MLCGISSWIYPFWDSLGFLDFGDYFPPHFRDVFNYYLLKNFLMAFLLSSSSGTPIIRMLERFILSWRSLRLSSFLLIRFSFLLSGTKEVRTLQEGGCLQAREGAVTRNQPCQTCIWDSQSL